MGFRVSAPRAADWRHEPPERSRGRERREREREQEREREKKKERVRVQGFQTSKRLQHVGEILPHLRLRPRRPHICSIGFEARPGLTTFTSEFKALEPGSREVWGWGWGLGSWSSQGLERARVCERISPHKGPALCRTPQRGGRSPTQHPSSSPPSLSPGGIFGTIGFRV